MTLSEAEGLLAEYLGCTGMHWARALWILGSLPTDKEIWQMLDYIVETETTDPDELYSVALKILRETKQNLLETEKK